MVVRSNSKKVLQSFHARATLWKLFEIRAQEMDCSIDYLINESMRLYATTYDFLDDMGINEEMGMVEQVDPRYQQPISSPPRRQQVPSIPSRGGGGRLPRPGGHPGPPQMPRGSKHPSLPRPGGAYPPAPAPPPGPHSSRRPPAPMEEPLPMRPSGGSTADSRLRLTLIFQGRKIPVTGEQFIIGRGEKASDLPIKDANISRKHAAVIYHNRTYYIKDLGSTNGIEYKGRQVDSKRIEEGDVFSICGYELHFTYSV